MFLSSLNITALKKRVTNYLMKKVASKRVQHEIVPDVSISNYDKENKKAVSIVYL